MIDEDENCYLLEWFDNHTDCDGCPFHNRCEYETDLLYKELIVELIKSTMKGDI